MALIDNNVIFLGSDIKLVLELTENLDNYSLSQVLKQVEFFSNKEEKKITLMLNNLIPIDEDGNKYLAIFNTSSIGVGIIKAKLICEIPDVNFPESKRQEIHTYNTGIYIVKDV